MVILLAPLNHKLRKILGVRAIAHDTEDCTGLHNEDYCAVAIEGIDPIIKGQKAKKKVKSDKEVREVKFKKQLKSEETTGDENSTTIRRSIITGCCIILICFFLGFGLICSIYPTMFGNNRGIHRGTCGIPIERDINEHLFLQRKFDIFEEKDSGESFLNSPLVIEQEARFKNTPWLEFLVDVGNNDFEILEMPKISNGRYLHDFKYNKTAIIDIDDEMCFIMPLEQDEIPRPRSLNELLHSLSRGSYRVDIEEVRHDKRVELPPVTNLEQFGNFIRNACENFTTFELVNADYELVNGDDLIFKRSVGTRKSRHGEFAEFTGTKMITYNIVNIDHID